MKLTALDDQVSISDQIDSTDVADLKKRGIEIVVCNRPDDEVAGQADFEDIARACQELGLESHHIPFVGDQIERAHVESFLKLLQSGKKVHAYCRSGARSSKLWARTRSTQGIGSEELIEQARRAGYDVSQHV
jgi:sulfide:quinone oxidoreductase